MYGKWISRSSVNLSPIEKASTLEASIIGRNRCLSDKQGPGDFCDRWITFITGGMTDVTAVWVEFRFWGGRQNVLELTNRSMVCWVPTEGRSYWKCDKSLWGENKAGWTKPPTSTPLAEKLTPKAVTPPCPSPPPPKNKNTQLKSFWATSDVSGQMQHCKFC